jgi:hypothetical protein
MIQKRPNTVCKRIRYEDLYQQRKVAVESREYDELNEPEAHCEPSLQISVNDLYSFVDQKK